jgi:hypothetical protein
MDLTDDVASTPIRPDLAELPHLETCWDADLDRWAHAVGEPRDGLDDVELRAIIKGRLLARATAGDTLAAPASGAGMTTLAQVTNLAIATREAVVRVTPLGAGAVTVNVFRRPGFMRPAHAARVGRLLRSLVPDGFVVEGIEVVPGYDGQPVAWLPNDPPALPGRGIAPRAF